MITRLRMPLLLFLIVTAFYWKLTFTNQFFWFWDSDLATMNLPWLAEETREVQHSQLPLWDAHSWMGLPTLGSVQPGIAYPLNWLLLLVPRIDGQISMKTLHWYFVVIHFMAALFCYKLCNDLGCSQAASLVGGLVFSLAG